MKNNIFTKIAVLTVLSVMISALPGTAFGYESKGKRDPFVPLVGPDRAIRTGLENIESVNDLALEGIAIGHGGKKVAIINGEMLKDNDRVGILEVKKVKDKEVIITISGKDYTLALSEEGGVKSEK